MLLLYRTLQHEMTRQMMSKCLLTLAGDSSDGITDVIRMCAPQRWRASS